MASNTASNRIEAEALQGQTLVRRFTNTLPGESTLELATIRVQHAQDAAEEQVFEARARALYKDDEKDDYGFHTIETERLALLETCKLFEIPEPPSRLAKLGLKRKAARARANEAIQGMATHGFDDLCNYVRDLENTWRSKEGSFARRFRGLCQGLEAHKNVFTIFPSHNSYASVLSGSLMLIIEAAVNHDEIADCLSEYVIHITEIAVHTADLVLLVQTRRMRELYSRLYAQVFLFYREAMQWYMESQTARFFKSFNNKLKQGYEQAIARIEREVTMMYRVAQTAQLANSLVANTEQKRNGERLLLQLQQNSELLDMYDIGQNSRNLLLSGYERSCIEFGAEGDDHKEEQLAHLDDSMSPREVELKASLVNRCEVRKLVPGLEDFCVGTEGRSFCDDNKCWISGVQRTFKHHAWEDAEAVSSTLWVSGLEVSHNGISSSRAFAMNILAVAWEAGLPTVSHFCERPRTATRADRELEKVGLIGLVYSLISQLLQFQFDEDTFEVSEDIVCKLNGSDESWPAAIALFSRLLAATPHLSICVIDSLNDLAFGAGAQWCDAFLRVLFEHQKASAGTFRILLTTTGQSRVLQDHVKISDRVFTQTEAREVIRGGRWCTSPEN